MTEAVRFVLVLALLLSACSGPVPLESTGPTPTESAPTPTPSETPVPKTPRLRAAVIGDFGTGDAAQRAISTRMCRRHQRRPFDVVITTGDNVYPDGHPDRFDAAFFDPYRCLFRARVPFHATLGNHDVLTRGGRPELREPAFGMERRNYVVRMSGVRFVLIDSNALDRDRLRRLTRERAGDRFTIVAFHHPVYSPGTVRGSTPGFRPGLPRIFRRRGVDLVLNGHDHIYAVTKPLNKIRYAVSGGGGGPLYRCGSAWFSARCAARHHFLEVIVKAEEVVVRAIPARGRPFHRFVTKGRA
jgi:hypothetical protein